jgi:UDP-N-acetyl-D-glucosamine dehydrogenase
MDAISLDPLVLPLKHVSAELESKFRDRSAKLGVIGIGYVGLALAAEMAKSGFAVTGIDIDSNIVKSINAGISYIRDVPDSILLPLVSTGSLRATQSFSALENLDAVSICVPTPLRKTKDPDLSYVIAAVEAVKNHLRPGQLIVVESTTYPGTTKEVVLPILEGSGLQVGKDFFLAYSPERIDPGNAVYTTRNIPKVIGGITSTCTALAMLLYSQIVEVTIPVSCSEAAEMVKLLENTFRSVNIALANEMATACHKLGINIWEVIEAAKTKPFGFMPFYPGPGLGGQCNSSDPHHLTWRARMHAFETKLIELAAVINSEMPAFTISRIADALNKNKKSLNGSKIHAIGVAYKVNTNDMRESASLEVVTGLEQKGATVSYSDPHVPFIHFGGNKMKSMPLTPKLLESADCAVILTNHDAFDYRMIAEYAPLVLDCRNALAGFSNSNIVRY